MPDYADLLPRHSGRAERALALGVAPVADIHSPLATVWRPDDIPLELLPWLACALSVDVWDDAWPEAVKRSVVRESIAVHRRKGTVESVKRALDALGAHAQIVEWWQEGGPHHTFRILVDVRRLLDSGQPFSRRLVNRIARSVEATKPASVDYAIAAFYGVDGNFYAGAALVGAARIEVYPLLPRNWSGEGRIEVAGVVGMNARLDVLAV